MKPWILASIALSATLSVQATDSLPPPYRVAPHGHDRYCAIATSQFAQGQLMRAKLLDPNKVVDEKTDIQLLAKKPLFKGIWEAIYHLVLHQNDGKSLSVVVVTTSYYGECPGDDIKTYVISQELGKLPSLKYLPDA